MLIVTGVIELNPEKVGPARAAALKMMEDTRKEPGCVVYEFSQLVEAPNRFRVYEEWDSEQALLAHFDTPHMAAFREALSEVGVRSREIFRVEGGVKTDLG